MKNSDYNSLDENFLAIGKKIIDKCEYNVSVIPDKERIVQQKKSIHIPIITIIIILLLTMTVFATPIIKDFFAKSIGLGIADKQGKVTKPLCSAKCNNITATVLAAIAGKDKIIIAVQYEGLSKDDYDWIISEYGFINLHTEEGDFTGNGYYLLQDSFENKGDGRYIEYYELNGQITKTQKVTLELSAVRDIHGKWNLEFELPFHESYEYIVNKQFEHEGQLWIVDKISIDAFSTIIEYRNYNMENNLNTIIFASDGEYSMNDYLGRIVIFTGFEDTSLGIDPSGKHSFSTKFYTKPVKPNSKIFLNVKYKENSITTPSDFTMEIQLSEDMLNK